MIRSPPGSHEAIRIPRAFVLRNSHLAQNQAMLSVWLGNEKKCEMKNIAPKVKYNRCKAL